MGQMICKKSRPRSFANCCSSCKTCVPTLVKISYVIKIWQMVWYFANSLRFTPNSSGSFVSGFSINDLVMTGIPISLQNNEPINGGWSSLRNSSVSSNYICKSILLPHPVAILFGLETQIATDGLKRPTFCLPSTRCGYKPKPFPVCRLLSWYCFLWCHWRPGMKGIQLLLETLVRKWFCILHEVYSNSKWIFIRTRLVSTFR